MTVKEIESIAPDVMEIREATSEQIRVYIDKLSSATEHVQKTITVMHNEVVQAMRSYEIAKLAKDHVADQKLPKEDIMVAKVAVADAKHNLETAKFYHKCAVRQAAMIESQRITAVVALKSLSL